MNITDKYRELNLEAICVAYDRYRNLYDGDWVQMGNYPEDGCSVPTEEGRKKAIQILKGLYQILIPYEQQIKDDWDSIRRNEYWMNWEESQKVQTMYDVCNDYHNLVGFMESLTQLSNEPQHSDNNSSVTEHKQQQAKQDIPLLRRTQQEIDVFGKALQKEYMVLCGGGYKWTKPKSLLAYMCGRLYCNDRIREDDNGDKHYKKGRQQLPAKELKALFNENVGGNRDAIKAPPRSYWIIDDLF